MTEPARPPRRPRSSWRPFALITAAVLVSSLSFACPGPATTPADDGNPAASRCSQALLGYVPAEPRNSIAPRRPIQPFYQWQSNNGYCGEVSILQGGMNNGLWASQYNVRLLCGNKSSGDDGIPAGTPLLQSGPDGYCAAHTNGAGVATAVHASQLLLDDGDPDKGQNSVLTCARNAGLEAELYVAPAELDGQAALRHFVSWIKSQLIAGHWVTTGLLTTGGTNSEYDHIVSVVSIGSNQPADDAAYDADDVIYFEDHGAYTFRGTKETHNPAVPPGAGDDKEGCVPYIYGIRVSDLGQTRASFDALTTGQPYALAIPDRSGGDEQSVILNFGVAITGPLDDDGVTRPVRVTIEKSSTAGSENPRDPIAEYNYEAPYIGSSDEGESCTNEPPAAWMDLQLKLEVQELTPGRSYNIYRYIFDGVKPPVGSAPVGASMALAVPRKAFNARKADATSMQSFTATGTTYTDHLSLRSDHVAVIRVVPSDAP